MVGRVCYMRTEAKKKPTDAVHSFTRAHTLNSDSRFDFCLKKFLESSLVKKLGRFTVATTSVSSIIKRLNFCENAS